MNHKLEQIKATILEYLHAQGYNELSYSSDNLEHNDHFILSKEQLSGAIDKLNDNVSPQFKQSAIDLLSSLRDMPELDANRMLHDMLRNGVSCFHREEGLEISGNLKILDANDSQNNILQVCHDFNNTELPNARDIILLVNGIPLVILRIVNDSPLLYDHTLKEILAYYKYTPEILSYNSLVIVTNGTEVATGAQFTDKENLTVWRELGNDNSRVDKLTITILNPDKLLDLITNFISFSRAPNQSNYKVLNNATGIKILANYYQYNGVNKLIHSALKQYSTVDNKNSRKLGVIANAYESELINSMLFYIGKLLKESSKDIPTIVCVAENMEVEDSFLQFLMDNRHILGISPIRAESASHLKKLCDVAGGGIIVVSIHKFYSEISNSSEPFSKRKNIFTVMMGRNACSYGSSIAKIPNSKDTSFMDNNFRDKFLPNASMAGFLNFTNNIENVDACNLCGDYVSIYDMGTAFREGIIGTTYYEKRITDYHIREEDIISTTDLSEEKLVNTNWQASQLSKTLEKKLSDKKRLNLIAKDIVTHFEERHSISAGKAMIVVNSRKIATLLYSNLINLRPKWESSSLDKGRIKIIMTHDVNDPPSWSKHRTTQKDRKALRLRFDNSQDPLNIVIVIDMWLVGFNKLDIHTIYWDKLLQGYELMRAMSRVNSTDEAKTAGLIMDYIGIEKYLKLAEENYINNGDITMVIDNTKAGVRTLKANMVKINKELNSIDYYSYVKSSRKDKHSLINETRDYIFDNNLMLRDIITMIDQAGKIYEALIFNKELEEYKPGLQFLHTLKSCILNLETNLFGHNNKSYANLIDQEVVMIDNKYLYGVKDIHSIQSTADGQKLLNHLMRISNYKVRDRALNFLVSKWVDIITQRDVLLGEQLLEKLRKCAIDYSVKLTPSKHKEYREHLSNIASDIIDYNNIIKDLGVSEDVYSIYNILDKFQGSDEGLNSGKLIELSKNILEEVLVNQIQDWNMMENARALLRVKIKHNLRKHNYSYSAENKLFNMLLLQAEKILASS